jgi:hypothetical protein
MFVQPTPESSVVARANSRGAWALGSRPLASSGAAFGRISFVSRGSTTYFIIISYSVLWLLLPLLLPAPRTPRQRSRGQHPFQEAATVVTLIILFCILGLLSVSFAGAGSCFSLPSVGQPFKLHRDTQRLNQRLTVH